MYHLQNPVNGLAPFRVLVAKFVEHPPGVRKVMDSNPIGTRTLSEFNYGFSTIPLNIINPHTATAAMYLYCIVLYCIVLYYIVLYCIIWLTDFACCDWSIPGP